MRILLLSLAAALVGFVHSLGPAHWLPIVLVGKARKWELRQTFFGILALGGSHVVATIALTMTALQLGWHFLAEYEEAIERYSGLALLVFGLSYAAVAYRRHASCCGHSHHGPEASGGSYGFLALLGLSPCIAVFPVILSVAPGGAKALILSSLFFAIGVFGALTFASMLVYRGIMKLDHPIFEHYGDVISGGAIALVGLVLALI